MGAGTCGSLGLLLLLSCATPATTTATVTDVSTVDTVSYGNVYPGDEPLPEGIGSQCEADVDCPSGLVCVLDDPPLAARTFTCQIPCREEGYCPDIYEACLGCVAGATPPYCENLGCE